MTGLVLLALAATAAAWWQHRARRRPGAGVSADARARQLRTPAVRLATLLGISTAAEALAARSAKGAEGERRTARLLAALAREGWTVRHDLALPRGRANVDHLLISPAGTPIVVDSKQWNDRFSVHTHHGRLLHDTRDVTSRLRGVVHEATAVAGPGSR
ncbi:nuclease-related domain-containing protein [Streptomyces sp. ME03-5709C]|nr:nuclease-related domain-containing protein [Streptomyces sp. ME03-5709C]